MDSDDSQDVSSANDSEVETHATEQKYAKRDIENPKSPASVSSSKSSSRSRSRSVSSDRQSSDSNPPSPAQNLDEPINDSLEPKSGDEEEGPSRMRIMSPNNVSADRAPSNRSVDSSRSNSPSNNHDLPNDRKSPLSFRHNFSSANNHDNQSVKSNSSHNSHKSSDNSSEASEKSTSSRLSREGRKIANLDDGNTSDSSESSTSSKRRTKNEDHHPEDISDGDIESEDNDKRDQKEKKDKENLLNLQHAHEDLSDVSDLDSNDPSDFEVSKESSANEADVTDTLESKTKKILERTNISEVVEEQLDFEAEDGECAEPEVTKEKEDKPEPEAGELEDDVKKIEKVPEELEEGELSDEDEARPEETEPRPVCRFFSRGQCTWGASCRFLHPGVTDKGNYTMFELVRPVVPGDYGGERLSYAGRVEPPAIESAWERGLRTAKEMMRKSIKRKEQDIDFEEKKMNLSLTQEELDKENGYYAKAPSPEPSRYVTMRHPAPIHPEYAAPPVRIPPEEYYTRRQVVYEPEYTAVPRERFRTYREVQPHRPPEYYSSKHEEAAPSVNKAKRPKREVIVQRVEERSSRADDWSDPWMRSKSPAGRKRGRKHSYSSGSSYSSSSSSHSSSGSSKSSYRSKSRSSHKKQRSPHTHRRQVSPSVIVSERKAANERAALMNPPAPRKRAPSPGMMRVGAQNPPAPSKVDQFGRTRSKLAVAAALARVKGQRRSSRSSSGSSSGSSSSDSDSSLSSSSSSRNASPGRRPSGVDLAIALKAKAIDALKSGSEKKQIKLNLKNSLGTKKAEFAEMTRKAELSQSRKRLLSSSPPNDPKNLINKKATSRREELLKQLKAVEDAIAKKRSKV